MHRLVDIVSVLTHIFAAAGWRAQRALRLSRFALVLLAAWIAPSASAAVSGNHLGSEVVLPSAVAQNPVSVSAEFMQAMRHFNRGETAEAVRIWRQLAENGDREALFTLGALFTVGDRRTGIDRDPQAAADWYKRAADLGHGVAQFNLGVFYANGSGVPQDMTAAARWWQRAAIQGHVEAQFNLGLLYAQGMGIAADPVEAVRWWELAARQGSAAAQFNLGVMYVKGEGVEENPNEAVRLWQLSARQGFGQAIHILKTLNLSE